MKKETRQKPVTIVAAFYWGMRFGEGMITAIQQSAPKHWTVFPMHFLRNVGKRLESLHIDGVIADLHTPQDVEAAMRLSVPVIDAAGSTRQDSFPQVCTDEAAVGTRAMDYLRELGYTRFAFLGFEGHDYSRNRLAGFQHTLRQLGYPAPEIIETPWGQEGVDRKAWIEAIARVQALSPKTGIFSCSDARIVLLHQFAVSQGLGNLFHNHGIVGVDNDRDLMRIHGIYFPSIPLDYERLGKAAVDLMARKLKGTDIRKPTPVPVSIAPRKVFTPEGYDPEGHGTDPVVGAALRMIRAEVSKPISVARLARELHVSQSTLERRFRDYLGQTPKQWIQRLRFDRAVELITTSDLSIKEISALVGFEEQRRLSVLFRHFAGTTPTAYRQNHRSSQD